MIVINSYDAAVGLLEAKSANTSDRPRLVMAELYVSPFQLRSDTDCRHSVGIVDYAFALMGYGTYWRGHRRMFHEFFHHGAISQYQSVFRRNTRRLLQNLLDKPENFWEHSRL